MKQKIADFLVALNGFRKFIAWLCIFLVSVGFTIKGLINGSEFVDLTKTVFAGFVAGNGIERVVNCVSDHLADKRATSTTSSPAQAEAQPEAQPASADSQEAQDAKEEDNSK